MPALNKRKIIHDYIDNADKGFINIIYQFVKYSEANNSKKSLLSSIQKAKLDKTISDHENGKLSYYTFDAVKKSISVKKNTK